ncbi:hypothetical protein GBC26_02245, partial [Bifidobacterium longum]
MSAMARPVMPARLGRGKTVRFGENGSRIVWNRLESSGIARNSLLMAVCRASCALNATLLRVVPEFLRTLVFARPRGDDQFADCTF